MRMLLGTGDYGRYGLPSSRLVNRYFETAQTTSEQVALIPRKGLELFATVDADSVIAVFQQPGTLDDLIMVVTANFIYALDTSGTVVGTTPVLNLASRVSMASGAGGVLYLTDGAQLLRCTVTQGSSTITVTAVPFPDLASCSSVAYLSAYFLFTRGDSHKVYFLRPGSTTIDALDFFSAEVAPDDLVGAFVLGDELWLMGASTVEVHTPTGDADLPFQRSIGRPTDFSLACRDTVQKLGGSNGSLFFVGADRIVYRNSGLPEPISDDGVAELLKDVTLSTLRGFQFGDGNHLFYGVDIPGVATEVFDTSTQRWHRMASYGSTNFNSLTTCRLPDGRWLAGDTTLGNVYVFGGNDDNGEPIVRVTPGIIETALVRCDNVWLDCSVGKGDDLDLDPQIAQRSSDDLETWSDWEWVSLGRAGDFAARPTWWRQGLMNGRRLFEFMDSNPVATVIRGARVNEPIR